MCQAKLEEESVRRGFKSSVVSEYITNLAKEISKQHVEDANWLILVAYVRVLEKKKRRRRAKKEWISFQAKFRGNTMVPKQFLQVAKVFKLGA